MTLIKSHICFELQPLQLENGGGHNACWLWGQNNVCESLGSVAGKVKRTISIIIIICKMWQLLLVTFKSLSNSNLLPLKFPELTKVGHSSFISWYCFNTFKGASSSQLWLVRGSNIFCKSNYLISNLHILETYHISACWNISFSLNENRSLCWVEVFVNEWLFSEKNYYAIRSWTDCALGMILNQSGPMSHLKLLHLGRAASLCRASAGCCWELTLLDRKQLR